MCGRYTITHHPERVLKTLQLDFHTGEFQPRYNVAPTQLAPVIAADHGCAVRSMRWGLIPFWAKDTSISSKLINARSETVREKPSFRTCLEKRRCLVLADGFYEWQKLPATERKQPFRITLKDRGAFAFAGLWDRWRSPEGQSIESFSIITTAANDLVRPVHDRMPVLLAPEHWARWLSPDCSPAEAASFLQPYPAEEMSLYPVSTLVNSAKSEEPRCIEPVTPGLL